MSETIKNCDKVINELYRFSDDLILLGSSISDNRLEVLESQIDFILPVDFKYIIKKHNGFSLNGTEVYGIDDSLKKSSIDKAYRSEHSSLMATWMPVNYLPFSPDGRGNHYCLVLTSDSKDTCPITFWQHDVSYKSSEDIEICNDSFTDWVKEVMIDWTLEDYNYDGTEKS